MILFKKPKGFSFEIGCVEDNGRKWFCYLGKQKFLHIRPTCFINGVMTNAHHGGFKLDISFGTLRRPIPKFWKKEFWAKDYMIQEPNTNPWNSGNHWFVLTIPVFIGIFLSISYGAGKRQPGIYIGCKTYEVNKISQDLIDYSAGEPWVQAVYKDEIAWGDKKEKGNIYLCPSASIRDDLVDG